MEGDDHGRAIEMAAALQPHPTVALKGPAKGKGASSTPGHPLYVGGRGRYVFSK